MAEAPRDLTNDNDANSRRTARKCAQVSQILMREEYKAQMKKISEIIKKDEFERSSDERDLLHQSPDMVRSVEKRNKLRELSKHRVQEIEDTAEELNAKCLQLAQAIRNAKSVVLYTGAGISTAASIPDYRGPSGVWTLLQQGIQPKVQDLSVAEPTYTHMAIKKLHQMGVVKHVVSQNCDGLHLRSGLPRHALSEIHGDMFIEVCHSCNPPKEYLRLFDVTERTGVRKHQTGRLCSDCGQELRDSIVHFGERSPGLLSPYNWEEAAQAADQADLILCIGTSLKVLKKYPCLWSPHKPPTQKPELYIINLQWTPKDDGAILKINGKCDVVLKQLLLHLGLTPDAYNANLDPIYCLAKALGDDEVGSTSRNVLSMPPDYNQAAVMSAIEHEKLRYMERRMKKGKRKRSNSRNAREPVLSQYYSDDPMSDSTQNKGEATNGKKEETVCSSGLTSPGCSNSVSSSSRNGQQRQATEEDVAAKNYVHMMGSSPSSAPPQMGLRTNPLFPGAGVMVPPGMPLGVPATSPDLMSNQSADAIKFHQTLQMLQMQSQLHLHQQALTQQLPPSERARVLEQQDMMRQAFNSLLVQQLAKLEEKKSPAQHTAVSTSSVPLPVPLPPPIMTSQLGGLWPQVSTAPYSCAPPVTISPQQANHKTDSQVYYNYPKESVQQSEIALSPPSLQPETSFTYPSIVNALQRTQTPSRQSWPSSESSAYPEASNNRKRKSSEADAYQGDQSQIEDLNFSSPKLSGSISPKDDLSPHLSPPLLPSFDSETGDGFSPMPLNPMHAIQSRLLAEDDKPYLDLPPDAKMKSALEFASWLKDPAFKNSMCAQTASLGGGESSYSEPPKLYEENNAVQRNLALVESVLSAECEGLFSESSSGLPENESIGNEGSETNEDSNAAEGSVANPPGWFGKGWNPKKFRRKKKIK
ncbi:hypothetical protein CAPTEDRAFT_228445 [Capitella teleta]|uniref:protein acetyllysine N-acetyltransferase n=1 Tax=Capitella teleta TaxID=283909 RepID=R7UG42_CAPTE|nr:hypothetical protein CAPTEDRAFT_228445 [Capitella teleta]|eukprot:ELU02773.1 hypothetical protein CAPTEDRAFT_228445 [Capitella teleta]